MISIPIEALKGKTIGEIQELIKQAESLPENQIPQGKKDEDLRLGKSSGATNHSKGSKIQDNKLTDEDNHPVELKPQTVQELLEEIENESI